MLSLYIYIYVAASAGVPDWLDNITARIVALHCFSACVLAPSCKCLVGRQFMSIYRCQWSLLACVHFVQVVDVCIRCQCCLLQLSVMAGISD